MALKKSREFIPDITSKVGQKMLQDQMDWMWGQLMGNLPVKALSTELKGIIEAKAEATTLEDLADALDELTAVSDGALTIWYSATDPAGKAEYDIWFRTTPQPYLVQRWIGGVYVDISSTATARALILAYGAQQTADGKIKVYRQNDAPTGLTATDDGDLWFDTNDSNKLYAWNGSTLAWVSAQDTHLDDTVNAMKTEVIQAANELRLRASLEATNDFGVAIETVMAEVLVTAGNITAEVTNKTAHVSSLPPALEDLYLGKLWVKTDTDEHLWWKAIVTNTLRSYAAQIIGTSAVFNDLSDDVEIDLTIKTTAVQETGTVTPTTPRAISGKDVVYAHHAKRNILKPGTTVTSNGVTMAVAADGTVTLNGTCTASAGSPVLFTVLMGFYLNGQVTFSANNTVAYGSDLQMRLLESSGAQVASPTTNFGVTTVGAKATFTLNNQYIYGWSIRVGGGVTYTNVTLKPQLEPGNTALGYVPYDGVFYALTPDATLWGLTAYEDEIGNDGHVVHRTQAVTFSGTESISSVTDLGTVVRAGFLLSALGIPNAYNGDAACMCSHFTKLYNYASDTEHFYVSNTMLYLFIAKSRLSSYNAAGVQAWLAGKSVQVLYQLATPIAATVAPVQINGADGYNVISAKTVVDPVTVDYLGSGWGLVSRNSRRVYASSKFIIDENGATVRHVLLDGITPYEAWSHLYGGGLEIFETSTGDFIGGLRVVGDKVVLSASALADPREVDGFYVSVSGFSGTGYIGSSTMTALFKGVSCVQDGERQLFMGQFQQNLGGGSYGSASDIIRSKRTFHIQAENSLYLRALGKSYTPNPTLPGVVFLSYYSPGVWGFLPGHEDINLGGTSFRWKKVYAVSSTISTSDEREKHDICPVDPEEMLRFVMALDVDWFRLNALPNERLVGVTAQKLLKAMKHSGMPEDYAGYVDELPDHSRLGTRPDQIIGPLISVVQQQQRRIDDLERKLDILMCRHGPA